MSPHGITTSQRVVERLLGAILRDVRSAARYRRGHSRRSFASDDLCRDATERCVQRIGTLGRRIAELDHTTFEALGTKLQQAEAGTPSDMVDRMDSDVLWSLANHYDRTLRVRVAGILRRRTPSCP